MRCFLYGLVAATLLVFLPVLGSAAPNLASISPSEIGVGSGAFVLTVLGAGFGADSIVSWGGAPLVTYYANSTRNLTASVPSSLLTGVGHFSVTVASGGSTSNSLSIYVAPPSVSEVFPYLVNAGSAATSVDVQGSDFAPGAVAYWNSTALVTTFQCSCDLSVALPASLLTADGKFTITVVNPGGFTSAVSGGGFVIVRPVIFGITPPSVNAGSPDLTVTITGAAFSAAGDFLSEQAGSTTWLYLSKFVNSGEITGIIPAAALSTPGPIAISIQSEITGAFSTAFNFSVTPTAPATLSTAIVNAASSLPSIAPGSLFSIYGTNLSTNAGAAAGYPLPIALAGTSVSVNGSSVPLLFVSPGQINAQIPYEVKPGTAMLEIQSNGQNSAPVTFSVTATGPGVITIPGGGHALAVNDGDGSLNSAASPAKSGQYVTLWVIGQGLVDPPVATGAAAPASPLSRPLAGVTATLGGQPVDIQFAGLAPGFGGLLQMNLVVPDVLAGEQQFQVTIGGIASNAAAISVGN